MAMQSQCHPPAALQVKAADCMGILNAIRDFISADIKSGMAGGSLNRHL